MIPLPRLRRVLLGLVLLGISAGLLLRVSHEARLAYPIWTATASLVALVVAADFIAGLRRGALGVDVIALLAIVAALVLEQSLAAVIVALMVTGGAALEEFAETRARHELSALLARAPRVAQRKEGEAIVPVAVEKIEPDNLLFVRSGELVPVDGILVGAPATLDESALTGEAMPQMRHPGEAVRSGVLNAGVPFWLRASASAEKSTYAAIVRLVQTAERERPPMVRLADRWAVNFLAITVVSAGLAWVLAGDPVRALAVLVVATPCPLILAAPVALVASVSRAAKRGVIVKGGGALERLARAQTVIFDKTGTLTSGTPELLEVRLFAGLAEDEVLQYAASLEQASQHAIAQAIVRAARARGRALFVPSTVEEFPGVGLMGVVGDRRVVAGSAKLMSERGLALPGRENATCKTRTAAATVWVALDGRVVAALLLTDPLRADASRTLRALRATGIGRFVLASGDQRMSVEAIGRALALDAIHSELTPQEKIALVVAERRHGPVLMVGDGINDAPALAAADVGIAIGARGTAAAAEAADVVLMLDRLDGIAEAVGIAQRARAIALQSIGAGMGLSVLAMAVAAAGYLPPVAGALLQEAIDIAVILNSLRALGGPHEFATRGGARSRIIAP